ncbi:MAG TPA: ribosome-associated translation inhibitor RaiA [Rhodocyclaceae bacterium]|nr:ribosome-associated translation inhibitor RaiA [Rhodocyclaceae bacterium]
MNLIVTGHHLEVTPAIREYVASKVDRVVRRFDQVTSANVILSVDKLDRKAEITLHMTGKEIFVEAHNGDLYAAIDQLVDKLDRQLVKHKEKVQNHAHNPIKRQDVE